MDITEKLDMYSKAQSQADKLHANAKDGSLKIDGIKYDIKFSRTQGVYIVTNSETGEEELRLNTRKITQAKKDLKQWFAS